VAARSGIHPQEPIGVPAANGGKGQFPNCSSRDTVNLKVDLRRSAARSSGSASCSPRPIAIRGPDSTVLVLGFAELWGNQHMGETGLQLMYDFALVPRSALIQILAHTAIVCQTTRF
jgi:hypothetical protein